MENENIPQNLINEILRSLYEASGLFEINKIPTSQEERERELENIPENWLEL